MSTAADLDKDTQTPDKQARKTEYVILCTTDSGGSWKVLGRQAATAKASALSHYFEDREIPVGDQIANPLGPDDPSDVHDVLFQAVPASQWKALRAATPRPRVPFTEAEAE